MRMNQDERRFDFHGLGAALKRAREEKGWTQAYVAELVDRDSRTIMNIENKGQYSVLVIACIEALWVWFSLIWNSFDSSLLTPYSPAPFLKMKKPGLLWLLPHNNSGQFSNDNFLKTL